MSALDRLLVIAVAALALLFAGVAAAQPGKPPPADPVDYSALARKAEGATAPPASETIYAQDAKAYAEHMQWRRDYERRGWEWHLFSTKLLFGVVLAIVGFGLYITLLQFRRDYSEWKPASNGTPPAGTEPAEGAPPRLLPSATTIKLSPAGLEMTSQIVGLLVLALSLAFFFLYVKDVYPMREVEITRGAPSQSAQDKAPAK